MQNLKLKKHKYVCKNRGCCYVEIPKIGNKMLKNNDGEKPMKVTFIIYADMDFYIKKMNTCHNNPEKFINNQNKWAYTFSLFIVYTLFI